PDAVLCNVGIATIGTDIPSIEVVMINRSTMSLPLWIQMCVRGSRPFQYKDGTFKDFFTLIDLGDNILTGSSGRFQECTYDYDWEDYFWNPKTQKKDGIGIVKTCPDCGCILHSSTRFCNGLKYSFLDDEYVVCGYEFVQDQTNANEVERQFIKVSK